MEFYYFGGSFDRRQADILEKSGFISVLFTYNPLQGDFFTKVARHIDVNKKIKYMIAVRAHTLSPQYLCMINHSLNDIAPNRLQINLISGHIKPNEKNFGGILGNINDLSSNIDRSNYLIEYLDMLEDMSNNPEVQVPDFYVTTTNKYVFDKAKQLKQKMIIHHKDYNRGRWLVYNDGKASAGDVFDLNETDVIIVACPVLRNTQEEIDAEFPVQDLITPGGTIIHGRPNMMNDDEYFTYDSFRELIKKLESQGIKKIMLHGRSEEERNKIIDFVSDYTKNNH